MTTAEVFAPAKINLALHVTGQRPDGYHLLDSLVVFARFGDRLTLRAASRMALTVVGPFAEGVPTDASNLVWKAARQIGLSAEIVLEKNLPHGAGIGGGSSDAAAVLRVAHQFGLQPVGDPAELGADVPVCLSSAPQRMQGIGDLLSRAEGIPPAWVVLVNPRVVLPTSAVFAALGRRDNPALPPTWPAWPTARALADWLSEQRNDLQAPACALKPVIGEALSALRPALLARLSGSGATCFGLCGDEAEARALAAQIAAKYPGWWVQAAPVMCDGEAIS